MYCACYRCIYCTPVYCTPVLYTVHLFVTNKSVIPSSDLSNTVHLFVTNKSVIPSSDLSNTFNQTEEKYVNLYHLGEFIEAWLYYLFYIIDYNILIKQPANF